MFALCVLLNASLVVCTICTCRYKKAKGKHHKSQEGESCKSKNAQRRKSQKAKSHKTRETKKPKVAVKTPDSQKSQSPRSNTPKATKQPQALKNILYKEWQNVYTKMHLQKTIGLNTSQQVQKDLQPKVLRLWYSDSVKLSSFAISGSASS